MGVTIDLDLEARALRDAGMLGRSGPMGNQLYAIDYSHLPPEAWRVIQLIMNGGPFDYPEDDAKPFDNDFGDLPRQGEYLEFTVMTPGLPLRKKDRKPQRGRRRIVARRNDILFFTACHYERVQGAMSDDERRTQTALVDEQWRNGFYAITGLSADMRGRIRDGVQRLFARLTP